MRRQSLTAGEGTVMRQQFTQEVQTFIRLTPFPFVTGGFSAEDAIKVSVMLEEAGIDLLELSGGSYEAPAMAGVTNDSRIGRDSYFLEVFLTMPQLNSSLFLILAYFQLSVDSKVFGDACSRFLRLFIS